MKEPWQQEKTRNSKHNVVDLLLKRQIPAVMPRRCPAVHTVRATLRSEPARKPAIPFSRKELLTAQSSFGESHRFDPNAATCSRAEGAKSRSRLLEDFFSSSSSGPREIFLTRMENRTLIAVLAKMTAADILIRDVKL